MTADFDLVSPPYKDVLVYVLPDAFRMMAPNGSVLSFHIVGTSVVSTDEKWRTRVECKGCF